MYYFHFYLPDGETEGEVRKRLGDCRAYYGVIEAWIGVAKDYERACGGERTERNPDAQVFSIGIPKLNRTCREVMKMVRETMGLELLGWTIK